MHPRHYPMDFTPQNRRKLVKNEQKWLRNLYNVPLVPLNSPGCFGDAQGAFTLALYGISKFRKVEKYLHAIKGDVRARASTCLNTVDHLCIFLSW